MDYSIFKLGNLIRINEYEFQDGKGSRDKYLIVVSINDEEAYIIHSLTTTKNKLNVPIDDYGCGVVNRVPYFYIPSGQVIGDRGFSFEEETLIFFKENVRKEKLSSFDKYLVEGILRIAPLDSFPKAKLKQLIKCLLKSDFVPIELIDELEEVKDNL